MSSSPPSRHLSELLSRIFGHSGFRAHQQEVCEAATTGRDVLLVMPTGAGKSLCYQLPALARGGTGLVISPLIALIDDQAGKLSSLGLRVARIHSGLSRDESRQACRNYLSGDLDFLFIAPERMRVPGFPEMLAKRKPALIAIDEAHCISQWGHDFRPDYRTLGQHLQALRPSPVIALTATATPAVQRDIAEQLQLQDAAIFITGFRRTNLAVEVRELSKPQRADYTLELLIPDEARPAIVYASSRKSAEELASKLGSKFPTAAYHAGLDAGVRERVQRAFLTGKLDVVVATVAFGMGVDKANVRTVVHFALPGSVEAYYQEIGRAGRDGLQSKTVLLYSFADRKMQEFFLERNYPARSDLERVAKLLTDEFCPVEDLHRKLKLDRETLDRSIEKLLAQGVATIDMNGMVRATGERGWQSGYEAQVAFRREQIDRMMAFAEGHRCRMTALVQHFGEKIDSQNCGHCDICQPMDASSSSMRQPTKREREDLRSILEAVTKRSTSTGKLFTDAAVTRDRKEFDNMLDGLARAGLVDIANDTFRNPEGRDVTYRKVSITYEGRTPDDKTLDTVWLRSGEPNGKLTKSKRTSTSNTSEVSLSLEQEMLEERLRAWRRKEADKVGKPAFIIFGDAALRAIAAAQPKTLQELRTVRGVGEAKLDAYGSEIVAICRNSDEPSPQRVERPSTKTAIKTARSNSEPVRVPIVRPQPQVLTAPSNELTSEQEALADRLRSWRSDQAREAGLPSFFIFSDSVLRSIAAAEPRNMADLRAVRGFGPEKFDKFGSAVMQLCRS